MKATVTVQMDNAAFEQAAGYELARILRDLADRVEGFGELEGLERQLRDINGNPVGKLEVTR